MAARAGPGPLSPIRRACYRESCLHPGLVGDASGVKTPVNLALSAEPTPRNLVQEHNLQLLIRHKLATGTLPLNSIPRVWGGPGNGESCDACELVITKDELLIEGISLANGRKPLQLHVECFHFWELERRLISAGTSPQP
jgi:hypothetical protein